MQSSLYEVLGVPRDAGLPELKAAYRAAVLRLHPDKATGHTDDEAFSRVQHAWEVRAGLAGAQALRLLQPPAPH